MIRWRPPVETLHKLPDGEQEGDTVWVLDQDAAYTWVWSNDPVTGDMDYHWCRNEGRNIHPWLPTVRTIVQLPSVGPGKVPHGALCWATDDQKVYTFQEGVTSEGHAASAWFEIGNAKRPEDLGDFWVRRPLDKDGGDAWDDGPGPTLFD